MCRQSLPKGLTPRKHADGTMNTRVGLWVGVGLGLGLGLGLRARLGSTSQLNVRHTHSRLTCPPPQPHRFHSRPFRRSLRIRCQLEPPVDATTHLTHTPGRIDDGWEPGGRGGPPLARDHAPGVGPQSSPCARQLAAVTDGHPTKREAARGRPERRAARTSQRRERALGVLQ